MRLRPARRGRRGGRRRASSSPATPCTASGTPGSRGDGEPARRRHRSTMQIVHTDLARTGTFACSDDDLNRLHEHRRLELPRQRRRRAHRLPDPRASRLDRRLPGLRAHRDAPLRRARLQPQVAALGARRPARRRSHRELLARRPPHQAPPRRPVRDDDRFRRAGATRSSPCRGSCTVAYGDEQVLAENWRRDGALGRVGARAGAHDPAPRPRAGLAPSRSRSSSTSGTAPSTGANGPSPGSATPTAIASTRSSTTRWPGSWPTRARSAPPTCTGRPRRSHGSPRSSAATTMRPAYAAIADRVADAWRAGVPARRRHAPSTDTQAAYVRALAFGLVPGRPARSRGRPPRRADPRCRHAPRHRLPRDRRPAPGARRQRPGGCRVRALCSSAPRRRGDTCSTAAPPRSGRTGRASTSTATPTSR